MGGLWGKTGFSKTSFFANGCFSPTCRRQGCLYYLCGWVKAWWRCCYRSDLDKYPTPCDGRRVGSLGWLWASSSLSFCAMTVIFSEHLCWAETHHISSWQRETRKKIVPMILDFGFWILARFAPFRYRSGILKVKVYRMRHGGDLGAIIWTIMLFWSVDLNNVFANV